MGDRDTDRALATVLMPYRREATPMPQVGKVGLAIVRSSADKFTQRDLRVGETLKIHRRAAWPARTVFCRSGWIRVEPDAQPTTTRSAVRTVPSASRRRVQLRR
jgi:hypothetical protein